MTARLELSLLNRLEEIPRMLDEVRAFGEARGMSQKAVFDISLALDELVTNIISYGYADEAEHRIELRLDLGETGLRAELIDDATAFNPLDQATPDLEEGLDARRIGGLGIHFVRSVMDDVAYRRDGARNHLLLTKRLSPA